MSVAARQLAEHLTVEYPGIRVSRNSCRLTASGKISQHSAYGGSDSYYSNALDFYGPYTMSRADQQDWLDVVYAHLERERGLWSIRLTLWRVEDHYGHIHVDFWPTMTYPQKWCGSSITPVWTHSDGHTVRTKNPEPENGRYNGSIEEEDMWADDITDKTWMTMFHSDVPGIKGYGRYYCKNDGTYEWPPDEPWGSNPHLTAPDGMADYAEKVNAMNYLFQGFSTAAGS